MATPAPSERDLLELEIGAFMGPHIKRARLALVLIGALFMLSAWMNYGDIADLKKRFEGLGAGEDSELKRLIDHAYILVVFTGVAGVVNIVLAAIAGKLTTFAIYTATGIFAAHSVYRMYLGAPVITDWQFWMIAIVLGMGFQAVYKANQLRRTRGGLA